MQILFVDIFPRSFDDFISMKFLIAVFVFFSWQPLIPTSPFINFGDFANLLVYCTLPVYYFGRNLPASLFIPPSPSIRNSRVSYVKFLMFESLQISVFPKQDFVCEIIFKLIFTKIFLSNMSRVAVLMKEGCWKKKIINLILKLFLFSSLFSVLWFQSPRGIIIIACVNQAFTVN